MISRTATIYSDSSVLTIVEDRNQLKLEFATNSKGYELQTPEKIAVDTANIYKPIQYLGAKHRPLPIILAKTLEAIQPGTFVLDMFSGSSVVSQVFNLNGLNVISNDALQFNSAFAKTLLNIEREETDLKIIPLIMEELKSYKLIEEFAKPFEEIKIPVNKEDTISLVKFFPKENIRKGVVLYFHGNTRSIKGWAKYARDFYRYNYDVVLVDYRGFGKSTGKRSEKEMLSDMQFVYNTLL